jgi:hypothetical protein
VPAWHHTLECYKMGLGSQSVKRPKKRVEKFPNKQKFLVRQIAPDVLEAAAVGATYAPSPYHCKENGRLRRRIKPQTPCPRNFTLQEAGNAVRAAIRARQVSRHWINGFPRRLPMLEPPARTMLTLLSRPAFRQVCSDEF